MQDRENTFGEEKIILQEIVGHWDLDAPEFIELRKAARLCTYPRQKTFFVPALIEQELLVIARGKVRVYSISKEGQELTLFIFGPGSMICETSMFSNSSRDTFLESMETVQIWHISRQAVEARLVDDRRLTATVWRSMEAKMSFHTEHMQIMNFADLETRVRWALRQIGAVTGSSECEQTISVTHEFLATFVGTSRSAVSQALEKMAARGQVRLARNKITLLGGGQGEEKAAGI